MNTTLTEPQVDYPDSDGEPMADNTLQWQWIVTIQGNLDLHYRNDPDVFVAGDHLIYPVKGKPEIRFAPDAYVAFGRPKGHRGSYKVFEEADIFPQVIFEVWSPGNRAGPMEQKREFYETYGAEEYYIVHPEQPSKTEGWQRHENRLVRIADIRRWVSPRLGIRITWESDELAIYGRDGQRFLSFVELGERAFREQLRADAQRDRADAEQERANAEQQRANAEQQRANAERQRALSAEQFAAAEQVKAAAERQRADRLAARLRELGLDPDEPVAGS